MTQTFILTSVVIAYIIVAIVQTRKQMKNGIKTAIGMAYTERRRLKNYKKRVQSDIEDLESDISAFTSYFIDGMTDIQNNMEVLAAELRSLSNKIPKPRFVLNGDSEFKKNQTFITPKFVHKEKKVAKKAVKKFFLNDFDHSQQSANTPEMIKIQQENAMKTMNSTRKVRSDKGVKRK